MGELKVYRDLEDYVAFDGEGCPLEVYDKIEVDKLIAELDEKLKNSRNARKYWRKEYLIEYKECCHQKYKRCLAMAKWCSTRSNFFFVVGRNEGGQFAEERFRRSNLYEKWSKRWQKLAEKFKETWL